MKSLIALSMASLTFISMNAKAADELFIVDAHRNIPLSDEDPIYKDYYLNAGEGSELKKNLVVNVVRKITVRDSNGAQSYGEIDVPVGQLRIIALGARVAVAREYKLFSRDENPMLEQTGLLVGDKVDLKGAFVDSKPMATPKRKVVEAAKPAAPAVVAPLPAAVVSNSLAPNAAPAAVNSGRTSASTATPVPSSVPSSAPSSVGPKAPTEAQVPAGLPQEFVKPATEPAPSADKVAEAASASPVRN